MWGEVQRRYWARWNEDNVVAGEKVILDTAAIGTVPLSELRKRVATLRDERALVQEALDTLFGAS
jgi:toxin CcdB